MPEATANPVKNEVARTRNMIETLPFGFLLWTQNAIALNGNSASTASPGCRIRDGWSITSTWGWKLREMQQQNPKVWGQRGLCCSLGKWGRRSLTYDRDFTVLGRLGLTIVERGVVFRGAYCCWTLHSSTSLNWPFVSQQTSVPDLSDGPGLVPITEDMIKNDPL